jgi:glucosamine--fructose-6-phosphate aminotransferase (isomerizing)
MCGIVGVLSRPPTRPIPRPTEILGGLDEALAARHDAEQVTAALRRVDSLLRGTAGVLALADHFELVGAITARLDQLDAYADELDGALGSAATGADADELERAAAVSSQLHDVLWQLRRDRLRTAHAVADLAGRDAGSAALAGYLSIQQALAAIDRMEVRGRDSAGVHVLVWDHELEPDDPDVAAVLAERSGDPLFQSGAARLVGPSLSIVYKAAAEIGELGDNTRVLREQIKADGLLRQALQAERAQVAVLGHTRWASVGIISEPNAHPVNSEELELRGGEVAPYAVGVLNGDVDNHGDLRVAHGLRFAGPITTDAKVIPALMARHASGNGHGGRVDLFEAFRRTVSSFEGSVAIGASAADEPSRLMLALHGSGQGVYVGLADDRYLVASEPYGVVEETDRYVRLDGEHGGQVIALDARVAGTLEGLQRMGYDGSPQPVTEGDVMRAEVTTRDIDRGAAPHFLLKEITESPDSMAKTLRGKIHELTSPDGATLRHAVVGTRALPAEAIERLAAGTIRRVRIIGQGTAAVAGQSMAAVLDELCGGALDVDAVTATELSGFGLRLDMTDTLVVAISQSGTTTDTNRTVDLLRSRGAIVLGIVNRRSSDLTEKAHGVLFTSDGRDVEMSVASTKAFYAQVAAGVLLACAISAAAGIGDDRRRHDLLGSLQQLPDAMREVLARREQIGDAARRFAPSKRYWAVVGSGANRVAAEEVRIKLSELCYKSIACDDIEDKKHIDLSSEPMILVCAAGLSGSTADDVGKEVAIFRAHKATPIVIADDGDVRYPADAVIEVPAVDPALGFALSAMAGHLFGYEAALAIDASARPLRAAREVIDHAIGDETSADAVLSRVRREITPAAEQYLDGLRNQRYDGHLEASTAVRLAGLLRDLASDRPVEEYQASSGKVASPAALVDDLLGALTQAIEELTRPIDAIKHQAKTVTVGISRSDEGVLDRPLVQAVLAAGAGRDVLSYRTLKVLAALDPAVADVTGFTRYGITSDSISIVDRGGISHTIRSRVERQPQLVGTKRRVAAEQDVLVARGRRDGRTVILVPEVKAGATTGITLLQVRFHDRLDPAVMRSVLVGYDRRYDRLVDWVTETEGSFDDRRLGQLPVDDLLIEPISDAADHWRS